MNCYVYRIDSKHGKDSSVITRTKSFDLPLRKKRDGSYKIPSGTTLYTCFSSDFFLAEADEWRAEAWQMIRERKDLSFFMITKRIDRFHEVIPADWGEEYNHVTICCTVENQQMAAYRLPIYLAAPIAHKVIICEPLLTAIDLSPYLTKKDIELVVVGGESGKEARVCNYDWVTAIREMCIDRKVSFSFKQTGSKFVKDGKLYQISRWNQHSQAKKANINVEF